MIALNLEDLLVEAGYEVTCVAGKRKGACANRRRRLRCGHRRCQPGRCERKPRSIGAGSTRSAFHRAFRLFTRPTAGCFSCGAFHEETVPGGQAHSHAENHGAQAIRLLSTVAVTRRSAPTPYIWEMVTPTCEKCGRRNLVIFQVEPKRLGGRSCATAGNQSAHRALTRRPSSRACAISSLVRARYRGAIPPHG